jgi:hypothetical protein
MRGGARVGRGGWGEGQQQPLLFWAQQQQHQPCLQAAALTPCVVATRLTRASSMVRGDEGGLGAGSSSQAVSVGGGRQEQEQQELQHSQAEHTAASAAGCWRI